MSGVKEYQPSEWERLLDHTYLTSEWVRPMNQDVWCRHLILAFYPLVVGKTAARIEQAAATLTISTDEVMQRELKEPSQAVLEEKRAQATEALRDLLAGAGLGRGVLGRAKHIAHRDAFKRAYQTSAFGDPSECDRCGSPSELIWRHYRGDWTVRCATCGWKKVFRRAWIDKTYRQARREAERENAKIRPFASSEDARFFYMKLKALYVPVDPHNAPFQVIRHS